jgi:hypothetical protein
VTKYGENSMKYVIFVGFAALVASPAYADEYYVIKIPKGPCIIVDHKPNQPTDQLIGTSPYTTKAAAKSAKKSAPECETAEKPEKK